MFIPCMVMIGLREAELWRMLSLLQYKAEHDNKVCNAMVSYAIVT